MKPKLPKLPKLILGRSGRWLMSWAEKDETTGQWHTRTETTHTSVRAEAEALRRRRASAMLRLTASDPDSDATLATLIASYLAEAEQRGVGATQRDILRKAADSGLGGLFPRELTPEVLSVWRDQRGVSDGTLRRDLGAIKAVLNWAEENKKLKLEDKPHIKLPPLPKPRDVWLNERDEQRLWDIASQDTDRRTGHKLSRGGAFVCIALGTGARREAITDLTWDRIDLKRRVIDFRMPGRRETKKVRVVAPINSRLLVVLQKMHAEWDQFTQQVIPGDGWPAKQVEKLLWANGFDRSITPHVFRHTFITLSLRAGVPIWDVSRLAGVSPVILTKHYAHHVQDDYLLAQADKRFAA